MVLRRVGGRDGGKPPNVALALALAAARAGGAAAGAAQPLPVLRRASTLTLADQARGDRDGGAVIVEPQALDVGVDRDPLGACGGLDLFDLHGRSSRGLSIQGEVVLV